jgi:hypothetical protein
MVTQSDEGRREVELTNVPVVVAQAERFRQRLSYWDVRVAQLDGHHKIELDGHHKAKLDGHLKLDGDQHKT